MSDHELNLAIHTGPEGWQWGAPEDCGLWVRGKEWDNHLPDYCNDPAWAVAMMEKHGLGILPHNDYAVGLRWEAYYGTPHAEGNGRPWKEDPSLNRAVALAVLALHLEGTQ